MKKIKFGDIVIITVILLTAAVLFGFRFFQYADGNTLIVSYGENEFFYSLNEDRIFTVENNGHTLVVEIKNKCAGVVSSDCPEQECVNMGVIYKTNESVACVPAEFFMKIAADIKEEYDGIVG